MRRVCSVVFLFFLFFFRAGIVMAQDTFWPVQAVDTMKFSRDEARNVDVRDEIDRLVEIVAQTGATHISIATPYNDEFVPVLTLWVTSARQHKLAVWFRGNFAEWEGWFGYQKFTDIRAHHAKTAAFIQAHSDLFVDGDIFTPVPEAENGGLGDPRGSAAKSQQYNQFLVDSYATCQQAFSKINKNVTCGYFSMNADVAREVLTPETVKKTGNVVVVDHYVKEPAQFQKDIETLSEKFQAPIVFGEFGAPIPDLNGTMTEEQQAAYVQQLMDIMYQERKRVVGMNYWTLINGSTSLLNANGSPRLAVATLTHYFKPSKITGKIIDDFGNPIEGVSVKTTTAADEVKTSKDGSYHLIFPPGKTMIDFTKNGYHSIQITTEGENGQMITMNEKLNPEQKGLWYYLRMLPVWIKHKIWG